MLFRSSAFDREMSRAGRCWYIPMMFNELPVYWQHNDSGVDIAFFQVAPMDKHGNFNIGPQVADIWGVIKSAHKVIVEVNENMPIAHGHQTQLNLYGIDYVVEGSNPPMDELMNKYASTQGHTPLRTDQETFSPHFIETEKVKQNEKTEEFV